MIARLKNGGILTGRAAEIFSGIGIAAEISEDDLKKLRESEKAASAKRFGGRPKGATNKPKGKAKNKKK